MKKGAYLSIVLAAFCWGFISVFFDMISGAGFSNLEAAAARTGVAAAALGLYLLITDRKALKVHKFTDFRYFVGTGVISLLFFNFCYFASIKANGSSVAAALLYTAPAFVMLMSVFIFKEHINLLKILAVVFTVSGCLFVTGALAGGAAGRITLLGAVLGIGSGILYALYSIFSKFALRHYSASTVSFYSFLFAALVTIPVSGITSHLGDLKDPQMIMGSLGLGIISCLLPYVLYNNGLKQVPAGSASVMATLEPVVASVIGVFYFHENMTAMKVLGIVLILGSVVALNTKYVRR